jgi:glycosyltransferase involved in cell wall biosynthesis
MERWIAGTIESVLAQRGDFFVEYIIVDDNSSDKTGEIVDEYEKKIKNRTYPIQCAGVTMTHVRRTKRGMYSAINDGFSASSGDIFAWINADDIYHPDAFKNIQKAFTVFPHVQWLKGITGTIDEQGKITRAGTCNIYNQDFLKKGIYGREAYFVEQDSVFWRASLWEKIHSIPDSLSYAGDYWLWMQFAHFADLVSLKVPLSYFRKREGQKSKDISEYKREQETIRPQRSMSAWGCMVFFSARSRITRLIPRFEPLFKLLYPVVFWNIPPQHYIVLQRGIPVMKETKSYVV